MLAKFPIGNWLRFAFEFSSLNFILCFLNRFRSSLIENQSDLVWKLRIIRTTIKQTFCLNSCLFLFMQFTNFVLSFVYKTELYFFFFIFMWEKINTICQAKTTRSFYIHIYIYIFLCRIFTYIIVFFLSYCCAFFIIVSWNFSFSFSLCLFLKVNINSIEIFIVFELRFDKHETKSKLGENKRVFSIALREK